MNVARKRYRRAILAVLTGMVFALTALGLGETARIMPVSVQYTAWWGTLYPKFCFAQKSGECGSDSDTGIDGESRSDLDTEISKECESVQDVRNQEEVAEERNQGKIKMTFWLKRFF